MAYNEFILLNNEFRDDQLIFGIEFYGSTLVTSESVTDKGANITICNDELAYNETITIQEPTPADQVLSNNTNDTIYYDPSIYSTATIKTRVYYNKTICYNINNSSNSTFKTLNKNGIIVLKVN